MFKTALLMIAILTLIQELLCIPEAIIQALTGGICGLRIIPWDLCSDEIKEALNMVRAILDAIKAFIAYLLSNLMNSNLDLSISIWMQVQLTLQLGCMGSVSALLGGNVGAGVPAL